GIEGAIQSGLIDFGGELLDRDWSVGGSPQQTMRIERLLIDMGHLPRVVGEACRQLGATAQPAKGIGITAARKPMSAYHRKPGERHGHHWYVPNVSRTAEVRHVLVDTNYWKSHVHRAIAITPGDAGSLTINGKSTAAARMLADHTCNAEVATRTSGQGRDLDEWKLKPAKPDNHLFDCLVGAAAAASMLGAGPRSARSREQDEPIKLSELQQRRRKGVA
ncbi:MAG: hypothetical protein GVY28_12555, partial [Alphaproteobacteria bacterium]|nr:hypothetical protein [Alphaproteobacteria bacterium]